MRPALNCAGGILQDSIVELGHTFGWIFFHARTAPSNKGWRTPVKYDGKGYPDLTCVHAERGIIMFREIKTRYEKVSDEQAVWLDHMDRAGGDAKVWRPQDWDEIVNTLTFGRGSSA